MLNTAALPTINGNKPQGFIADFTTYWYQCSCEEEGYYLSALLNAPSIDGAIKLHQPRGLFGARHITRLPFEVCSIPTFDARNREHQQLATLSQAAHKVIAELDLLEGGVAAARKKARRMAHSYIEQIDAIARYMLGLPSGLYPMLPGRLMAHVSPPRAPMKRFRSLRQRVLHAL